MSKLPHHFGLIEIGANGLRLAIYHAQEKQNLSLTFIEKRFLGLGRYQGQYLPLSMQQQLVEVLTQFLQILGNTPCPFVIATAGLRQLQNADKVRAYILANTKLAVHILSADQEALCSGQGIALEYNFPDGLMADLGGGSLELALLTGNKILHPTSFHIGSLAPLIPALTYDVITRYLPKKQLVQKFHAAPPYLYLTGGGFRQLGNLYLAQQAIDWPTITPRDLAAFLKLSWYKELTLERHSQIERIILILKVLLDACPMKTLSFCSHGVREGYLYEKTGYKVLAS